MQTDNFFVDCDVIKIYLEKKTKSATIMSTK